MQHTITIPADELQALAQLAQAMRISEPLGDSAIHHFEGLIDGTQNAVTAARALKRINKHSQLIRNGESA